MDQVAYADAATDMPTNLDALIRMRDWSASPLGAPDGWPQSLRTTIGLILPAQAQIVLFWGPEYIALYNEAYAPTIGDKHPRALGRPAIESWTELWDDLEPLLRSVRETGETVHAKDRPFYIERHGYGETVYFDISYSPVADESGGVGGVMCIVSETTDRVRAETLLRESEARFRALVNASSDVVYRMSSDWTEMRQLDGRAFLSDTPSPSVRWLEQYILDEDRPKVMAATNEAMTNKTVFALEHRVRRVDGGIGWTSSRAIPVLDQDGEIVEWFGMAADITARRQADHRTALQKSILEAAIRDLPLKDSLAELIRAVEVQSDAGMLTSILLFDEGHLRHGAAPSLPAAYNAAIDGIAVGPGIGSCGTAASSGAPVFVTDIDTDPLWTDFRALALEHGLRACWSTPIFSGQRAVLGTFAIYYREPRAPSASDIDLIDFVTKTAALLIERKRAEEQTRLLAAVVEQADDFVGIARPDGVGTFVNRAGKRMVGLPDDFDVSQVSIRDFFTPHDQAFVDDVIMPAQVERGSWSGEFRFRRFDTGDLIPVLYSPFAIRDEQGAISAFATVTRDITDRKRDEEALRRLTAELEERVSSAIEERQAALEQVHEMQKMDAMGQLTGGVAHDFNNLLTPIIGALDMIQRKGNGDDRQRRLVTGALQSAERAKTLVQRLLAFARRQPLQPVPVDIAGLVSGMADLVSSTTGPQIKVVVNVAANLPPAKADPNQLEMALLNLTVNARDAMPDGGTLRISASAATIEAGMPVQLRPGDYICLSVADTGVGMDEATLERAVEPFFSTKGVGKGTGLGLSMVHGLACQLGGGLKIRSKPGLGTNIELWLPQSEEMPLPQVEPHQTERSLGKGTALLVEDEELVRLSTAHMLGELGYRVLEAGSAEDALKVMQNGVRPDLVVTDHLMPGMTGTDLARVLRDRHPGLRVLIVSGYAEEEGIAPDLPRLSKPFRQADLADALASLLNP